MAIANPSTIASLLIDGTDLGLTAPETWEGGTKTALRAWYYRKGIPTLIQSGRVTPEPVRLSFRLTGPDALQNALYLDGLQKTKRDAVPIVWGPISFAAKIQQCTYTASRSDVAVTLELLPVDDPNPQGQAQAPQIEVNPVDLLSEIGDAVGGLLAQVEQASKFFDNAFQGMRDAVDNATAVIARTEAAITGVAQIAQLPAATAATLGADLVDASARIQNGAATIVTAANAQAQLPAEIVSTVTTLATSSAISGERMEYIAAQMTPATVTAVLTEGQTATDIAEAAGVSVADLIAANPDLIRTPFTPGTTVEVPDAGA
jgi:hypothetical protein